MYIAENNIMKLVRQYNSNLKALRAKRTEKNYEIVNKHHDLRMFIENIKYHIIDKSGDLNFPAFYEGYSKIFTIEEERESYNGFEEVLDYNYNQTMQEKYGPFKEIIMYCTDPDENEIIGGINFSTYFSPFELNNYIILGTSQLFYIFIKSEYRFLNLGSVLLQKARRYSESLIKKWADINDPSFKFEKNQLITFCEQNYPEKMTARQYWLDNINSLTDQCDRLGWWYYQGFRRLKFNYIQPSLNTDNDPCLYLSLNAAADSLESLPSALVLGHIKRFFAVSVLKGRDLNDDINYKKIESYLKANSNVYFENEIDLHLLKKLIVKKSNFETLPDVSIGDLISS
jgi:hypothetical protein